MADTHTTHLNLIKQDGNAIPDYTKDHTNLNTLDSEVWARGKAFNGTTVGDDGEFHVRTIPYAENLETASSQRSNATYVIRTAGGDASINDGNAWLTIVKGSNTHTGYSARSITMTPTWQQRAEGVSTPTVTINEETFVSYVTQNGTTVLSYSNDAWSANPANYGVYISGDPINGDYITIVYYKEVPGTITVSTPTAFTATGWNLYDHTNTYARVIKYSNEHAFKISGTYTSLKFVYSLDSQEQKSISPANGGFNPFETNDPIGTTGYLLVEGGNTTDTAIWMTWSDWGQGYRWNATSGTQGAFEAYRADVIDISTFMSSNFPYGLLKAGTALDEINFNVGMSTSRVERLANNSTNMATAKASGRQYEYDEQYIYLERATPVTHMVSIDDGYNADDHGLEFFSGTTEGVYAETVYGANLKNKLERDVLTVSQQTLDAAQQQQVKSNIGIVYSATQPSNPVTGMIWLKPEA